MCLLFVHWIVKDDVQTSPYFFATLLKGVGYPSLIGHNVKPHFLAGYQKGSKIGSQLVSAIMKGTGDSAITLVVGGCAFWQSRVPHRG